MTEKAGVGDAIAATHHQALARGPCEAKARSELLPMCFDRTCRSAIHSVLYPGKGVRIEAGQLVVRRRPGRVVLPANSQVEGQVPPYLPVVLCIQCVGPGTDLEIVGLHLHGALKQIADQEVPKRVSRAVAIEVEASIQLIGLNVVDSGVANFSAELQAMSAPDQRHRVKKFVVAGRLD